MIHSKGGKIEVTLFRNDSKVLKFHTTEINGHTSLDINNGGAGGDKTNASSLLL